MSYYVIDIQSLNENFCTLTEYIIREEYFTLKSICENFPKISEKTITECVNSLKNMKIVN